MLLTVTLSCPLPHNCVAASFHTCIHSTCTGTGRLASNEDLQALRAHNQAGDLLQVTQHCAAWLQVHEEELQSVDARLHATNQNMQPPVTDLRRFQPMACISALWPTHAGK